MAAPVRPRARHNGALPAGSLGSSPGSGWWHRRLGQPRGLVAGWVLAWSPGLSLSQLAAHGQGECPIRAFSCQSLWSPWDFWGPVTAATGHSSCAPSRAAVPVARAPAGSWAAVGRGGEVVILLGVRSQDSHIAPPYRTGTDEHPYPKSKQKGACFRGAGESARAEPKPWAQRTFGLCQSNAEPPSESHEKAAPP